MANEPFLFCSCISATTEDTHKKETEVRNEAKWQVSLRPFVKTFVFPLW
jgi:hypothetical protein